jgi:transglutaminase-like putative cysteine protease
MSERRSGTGADRGDGSADRLSDLVDGGFTLVLIGLGLVGFQVLFGGYAFMLVGLIGAVLGGGIAEVTARKGLPVVVTVLGVVALFLLVGGVLSARSTAIGGVLPSASTLSTLLHAGVYGWKELLTTAPPVSNTASLLSIPYLIGLVGGVVGQSFACRTRSAVLPSSGPVLVLTLGILFGSRSPASLLLQGTIFGGLVLVWVFVRYHRYRPLVVGGSFSRRRFVWCVGMVGAAVLLAGAIGPHLPGAGSRTRLVLSRYVVPPSEISAQPSPLSGFRQYVPAGSQHRAVLFTVTGISPGGKIRIAAMDSYDGVVWGFGTSGPTGAAPGDSFQSFGSVIAPTASGTPVRASVTVGQLGSVWLPEIGSLTGVHFLGPGSADLSAGFRYDEATTTAADAVGLRPGEQYEFTTIVPPAPSADQLKAAAAGSAVVPTAEVPSVLQRDANDWAGDASSPWGKVENVATYLKLHGKFSNGDETPVPLSQPGHDALRLETLVDGGGQVGTQIVGDDEQYAAALALMSNSLGVPARVVLGADVGQGGVVTGADVHAWVEVNLDGIGWVPVYPSDFLPTAPPQQNAAVQQQQQSVQVQVQPPINSSIHAPVDALGAGASSLGTSSPNTSSGFELPGWLTAVLWWLGIPVAVATLLCAGIIGVKRRRRNRRRRAQRATTQIAGAWDELVDLERDLGMTVPAGTTRREQAPHLQLDDATALAGQADQAVFGPGDPTHSQVEEFWSAIDRAKERMLAGLNRHQRWRAAVSLRSLRVPTPMTDRPA